jgi:hypothetical protein
MRYRALSRDGRRGGAGSFSRQFIEKLAAAGALDLLARAGDPRAFAAGGGARRDTRGRRDPRFAIGAMTAL